MAEQAAHVPRGEFRMLAGFAVAPPTAVLIALATYDVLWYAGRLPHGTPIDSLDAAVSFGAGVGILAVVVTIFGALPAVVWLNRTRTLSLSRLLLLGAALGNVPFALIAVGVVAAHLANGTLSPDVGWYWYGFSGAAVRTAMGLICGLGSAAAFWLVALRGSTTEFAGRQ